MATTQENIKEAFAGESQASQMYRAFAKKAERDGFPNVAKLFRTASAAEQIHAEGHFKAMDGVGSTADNLQAAIDGRTAGDGQDHAAGAEASGLLREDLPPPGAGDQLERFDLSLWPARKW